MEKFKIFIVIAVLLILPLAGFSVSKSMSTGDIRSQILEILLKVQELQKQLDELKKIETQQATVAVEKSVSVISPSAGSKYEVSKIYEIKWSSTGFDAVNPVTINLIDDRFDPNSAQGKTLIVKTTNTGSYIWKVPETLNGNLLNGGLYKVEVIVGEGSSSKTAICDAYLPISRSNTSPYATVIFPNGGVQIVSGTKQIIKWDSIGYEAGKITIDLYKGNIKNSNIATDIQNKGYYEWNVPQGLNGNYKILVKVFDESGTFVAQDYSDTTFQAVVVSN